MALRVSQSAQSCTNYSPPVLWPCVDVRRGNSPSRLHRGRRPPTFNNLAAPEPPTLYNIPGSQDPHPLNPRRPRRLPSRFDRAFERALSCRSRRVRAAGRTATAAICSRPSNLVWCGDAMMGLQGCLRSVSPGCAPTAASRLAARAGRSSFVLRRIGAPGFGRLSRPPSPLPSLRLALRSPGSSLLTARPHLRAAAALSAAGLGVFTPPAGVARVLIARDDDAAGRAGAERLDARCRERGFAVATLVPAHGDFNDDLIAFGAERLGARIDAAEASLTTTGQRPEPHRGQPPQQPIHPSCL